MKKGHLSDYFQSVAIKRLSSVEVDRVISHQHELDGVKEFKDIFGATKKKFNAKFLYLADIEDKTICDEGQVTWYDARENHPSRTEYRLYYQENTVFELAHKDDLLIIGKIDDNDLLVVIAEARSTSENQLAWLFDVPTEKLSVTFTLKNLTPETSKQIDFVSDSILSQLGIETKLPELDKDYVEQVCKEFSGGFPPTKIFSEFSRSLFDTIDCEKYPDKALLTWMEQEEFLFRSLEECLLGPRLKSGFDSVDDFISFSLSVQNRRKSRAGYAFENHLENILLAHKLKFDRNKITEMNSRPDFIFPGISEYHNNDFPTINLHMLAVKTTCKDRWRQVLAEANRIKQKHLITLETSISITQTEQMKSKELQLVVPIPLQQTYHPDQQNYLISLSDFISLVR